MNKTTLLPALLLFPALAFAQVPAMPHHDALPPVGRLFHTPAERAGLDAEAARPPAQEAGAQGRIDLPASGVSLHWQGGKFQAREKSPDEAAAKSARQ
jgi:hypothetical protein